MSVGHRKGLGFVNVVTDDLIDFFFIKKIY